MVEDATPYLTALARERAFREATRLSRIADDETRARLDKIVVDWLSTWRPDGRPN
jgi:hypothetical protein